MHDGGSGLRLFVKLWPVGWGLTICLWLGPPWFNYWFSFTLAYSWICHEYSSLFIIVINLIFMFSLWCIDWVGSLYANRIFMYFCMKSSIGRVKLASCKIALNPPMIYSTDRSEAVVSVLVLLFVALWFILRGDLFFVLPCVILFLCFSVILALRLPRLWKRELFWVFFIRLFALRLFAFVCFLFLLVSGKGCGFGLWHFLDFFSSLFCIVFKSYIVCEKEITTANKQRVRLLMILTYIILNRNAGWLCEAKVSCI